MQIIIAMPVYEDWESAFELCRQIDVVFAREPVSRISIILIDDGSSATSCPSAMPFLPGTLAEISVVHMRRNLGHQRAIAVGLTYIHQHRQADAIVVMDSDGEDKPEEIPKLLAAMKGHQRPTAVFAARGRRFEHISFRLFYFAYRVAHRFLAGRNIRFGNFSVLPWPHLESLVVFPELWNHYAATLVKSRLPYAEIRSDRGVRFAGRSRMNFVDLVVHGLSALFANQEVVGTRLLMMNVILAGGLFFAIAAVIGVKLLTNLGIPGWATSTIGLLLILLCQSFVASVVLVFATMMNRSELGFLPIRDYCYFIKGETRVYSE